MTEEKITKEEIIMDSADAEETKTDDTPIKENEKNKNRDRGEKQLIDENRQLTAKITELTGSLENSESELNETRDKYLRVLAEYDNFRKRSTKERDGIFADAYSDAFKEILPIFDNLERAVQYTEPEQLTDGLALIFKSVKDTLTKLGVEEFGTVGDQFDPLVHNAVMHCEDDNAGTNEIVEVFQKGYRKGDRIIRHAIVKVVN